MHIHRAQIHRCVTIAYEGIFELSFIISQEYELFRSVEQYYKFVEIVTSALKASTPIKKDNGTLNSVMSL